MKTNSVFNVKCKICGNDIDGIAPGLYVLNGREFHLTATVHDECRDKWLAKEAVRKPYRQPLEGQSNRQQMLIEPEIQDWDNP